LLATDGSSEADVAVRWLGHLPLPPDREVMVVTVIESPPSRWPGTRDVGRQSMTIDVTKARRVADRTASRVLTGRRAVGRVALGDPQDVIVASAVDWKADLVVLGTRNLGWIEAFFRGGVSLGVVRSAPCPVLVCKGRPRDVRTVTVALDGSPHARQALDWLSRLPLAPTTRIGLVGVIDPDHDRSIADDRREQLEAELSQTAGMIGSRGVSVETILTTGVPAARIVEEAERHGADLLVVGARGIGAVTRLILGSTSEAVLRRARCPVLVVPAAVHAVDVGRPA
jgi:nucleotide-binding universal stress UspA family protein